MSGYLLDTNVISMLAPSEAEASAGFLDWLDRIDSEGMLFLSVVTVHEVEKGIALLDHKGSTAKAAGLQAWLGGLVSTYDDNPLALTRNPPPSRGSWKPGPLQPATIPTWPTP